MNNKKNSEFEKKNSNSSKNIKNIESKKTSNEINIDFSEENITDNLEDIENKKNIFNNSKHKRFLIIKEYYKSTKKIVINFLKEFSETVKKNGTIYTKPIKRFKYDIILYSIISIFILTFLISTPLSILTIHHDKSDITITASQQFLKNRDSLHLVILDSEIVNNAINRVLTAKTIRPYNSHFIDSINSLINGDNLLISKSINLKLSTENLAILDSLDSIYEIRISNIKREYKKRFKKSYAKWQDKIKSNDLYRAYNTRKKGVKFFKFDLIPNLYSLNSMPLNRSIINHSDSVQDYIIIKPLFTYEKYDKNSVNAISIMSNTLSNKQNIYPITDDKLLLGLTDVSNTEKVYLEHNKKEISIINNQTRNLRSIYRLKFIKKWFAIYIHIISVILAIILLNIYKKFLINSKKTSTKNDNIYFATNLTSQLFSKGAILIIQISQIIFILDIVAVFYSSSTIDLFINSTPLMGVVTAILPSNMFIISLLTILIQPLLGIISVVIATWILVLISEFFSFLSNLYYIIFTR